MRGFVADFDIDQQAVIEHSAGARCIQAGPGSGKTHTMVGLVKALIYSGVPASQIRCVTFSKEAAATIEKRSGIHGVFSTFHSLGYLICSETERKPVEPELRHRLMIKLVRKFGLDYKELDMFIAKMRREGINPQEASNSGSFDWMLTRAYVEYEAVRAQEGWMDFDSMLADAVDLLEKNQHVRARWQPKYLIVDEAQDTDDLQWRMMQLMSERHGNITVVGDPNQAIYGFRGAKPENLTNFQQWFSGGTYQYLGRNYRSTETIVKFVRENAPKDTPAELLKRMVAARGVKGNPIGIRMFWKFDDESETALALANRDPLNSCILARTNRDIGVLEGLCAKNSVKYHLLGKSGFWKQGEIRKVTEALKAYPNSTSSQALSMVLPAIEAKYAVDDRTDRDNDALANLKTFREIAKKHHMARDLMVYANKMMHRRNDPRGVTISTVHQAKGGEWKNVFIIGADANGFPHTKGDPKEEQRIWFVAISRAIDSLRISFSGTPSIYLRKYLTEEILDKLREKAEEVERLQQQAQLF